MKTKIVKLFAGISLLAATAHAESSRANMILMMADDDGWGDVRSFNVESPSLPRKWTSPEASGSRRGAGEKIRGLAGVL
ncbi:hypothetical protein JO972_03890 [Verrucomicrobiaceae bacterium 5K15]|uniref:Sulfatase N-terminal domain-containing protein n=1 Tax=Oceaniferula flava TaxID=2800421 RepID=A0AAE2V7M7_9BACT|nr:hypothetical protein [Oceaniferula flavus]MBK1854082.1 hypothetical protein [Oceaniferula flavus]MBM1135388.1 hypothetical protein [Oceaniferula flavus]